ncbi:hypothetical protein F2P56_017567 [Juglans regia]|uniref:RING-type domain-containing protein n=1 Tax=Juglans regia TaxID=51240 RepID=A0A833X6Q9_JUGRE|nr:hypothetical protein F2P56_017567 [Juglans regia]
MDVPSVELHCESQSDTCPLLMARPEYINSSEHVIDITGSGDASSSSLPYDRCSTSTNMPQLEDRPSSSVRVPDLQPSVSSSNGLNSRNSSLIRRGDARRRRSPLNSGLWISIELVLTASQIVASVVVLSLSRNEHPRTPLFVWIVGYASGCVATLPLLYWRYHHRNQVSEQDSTQSHQTSQINVPARPVSLSVTRNSEAGDRQTAVGSSVGSQHSRVLNARIKGLVEYFKIALDCFFAVWFVVGNVWLFGGHSSADEAPNLYREEATQTRGATPESIDALPTYKFKLKKSRSGNDRESNSGGSEGGVVAIGTEKERAISGEDAACCICLGKYANNDELRELPCSHFFHKDCVDKWLRINALCPLCKSEVGGSISGSLSGPNASQRRGESRVGNGLASNVL